MDLQLHGKKAFISGSTAGIGYAIAEGLVREGAAVVINGRTEKRVQEAMKRLADGSPSEILGIAADLGTAEGAEKIVKKFPEIDILINNVGIFEPKPFEQISDADWLRFFEVNVMSGVRLSRHYLPRMKSRGWGRIVFISSESGLQIPMEMIHYGMTKTAQLAIARGMAETTAGTGVTVNSVLAGPTASEGVGEFVQRLAAAQNKGAAEVEREFFRTARPTSLLQRFAQPAEVAALVTFICSPLSSATNGAALRADGGVVRALV
jgi:NAD(P)-dependent dehydrogenase (short-subunit alcohol dehydrogenase family)